MKYSFAGFRLSSVTKKPKLAIAVSVFAALTLLFTVSTLVITHKNHIQANDQTAGKTTRAKHVAAKSSAATTLQATTPDQQQAKSSGSNATAQDTSKSQAPSVQGAATTPKTTTQALQTLPVPQPDGQLVLSAYSVSIQRGMTVEGALTAQADTGSFISYVTDASAPTGAGTSGRIYATSPSSNQVGPTDSNNRRTSWRVMVGSFDADGTYYVNLQAFDTQYRKYTATLTVNVYTIPPICTANCL